jgi:transposase
MTTSMLYHAYGIAGVNHTSTKYEGGQVIIAAEMTHNSICCPECRHYQGIFRGKTVRRFHLPPFGSKKCFLELTLHRVECHNCHHLYWPVLPFMQGMKRMTRSFIRYALELLKFGTIKDVATHVGVGWDTIKEIHKEALERKYDDIPLEDVEYVAIDEFSIRKGHNYMTVISDLKTGRIIHAVEGRKEKDIEPFLQRLKKKPLACEPFAWI